MQGLGPPDADLIPTPWPNPVPAPTVDASKSKSPRVVSAEMLSASKSKFTIYINGVPSRPGPEGGTGSNPVNVDLPESAFTRTTLLAVKEEEMAEAGRDMIFSYVLQVTLSTGKKLVFISSEPEQHRGYFDSTGLNLPHRDSKGREWNVLGFEDGGWLRGKDIQVLDVPHPGIDEAKDGRLRTKFLSVAPKARSESIHSCQYWRRILILWEGD